MHSRSCSRHRIFQNAVVNQIVLRGLPPTLALVGVLLFRAVLGAAVDASAPAASAGISSPRLYLHCLRDNSAVSFAVRWDYEFITSSRGVSGFRIYRRVEEGDYAVLGEISKSGAGNNCTVYQHWADKYSYSYIDRNVEDSRRYSYKVVAHDEEGNETSNEIGTRTDPRADAVAGPRNVLVVVNGSSPQSVEIGEYYRSRRGIPKENLCRLSLSSDVEAVSTRTVEERIKSPLREFLASRGLKDKILYIVMTYGLPYKVLVRGGESADSVDAHLTDPFDEIKSDPNSDMGSPEGLYRNPYYLAGSHFSRANGNRGYLVARLDGPLAKPSDARYNERTAHPDDPLQYIKNMVDYAIEAEQSPERLTGKGYFDRQFLAPWTTGYGKGDLSINGACDCCASVGFTCALDTNPQLFGMPPTRSGGDNPLVCDRALWYAGWYAHFYTDVFEWEKGAVGFHLESWTAQEPRRESKSKNRSGWLWVPGMIRAGITATMGPVHEPGLGGVPEIDWFFRYFFHGFSFAEAAYMAMYSMGGKMVMIGDPLYKPFRNNRPDKTPPRITIASPVPGQTVRGCRALVEGTVDDPGISMLDNTRPVLNGRFNYTQAIGSTETNEATLPIIIGATDTCGNRSSAAVTIHWVNSPPSMKEIEPLEVREGDMLRFTLKGSDADDDRISYSLAASSVMPRGASLDERTGEFRWQPDFDQAGTYDMPFLVSDGFASNTKRATITVRQAGSHPPKFGPLPKRVTRKEGEAVYVELTANDLDGDVLTFSTESPLPEGATLAQLPPNYGGLFWKPAGHQAGFYRIVFRVSDGKGGEDTAVVELEVSPADSGKGP
jgi:uncharacterized protein (TIGR03790 family)